MRAIRVAAVVILLAAFSFAQENHEAHHHPLDASQLGSVDFQTSCATSVRSQFNRGVALLHSFEYDEAHAVFKQVAAKDPTCAMAYWGIAMSRLHGLWGEFNAAEGKAAVEQAQKLAASAQHTTAREKQYIDAIAEIYSDAALKRADRPDNKPNVEGYSTPDPEAEAAYAAKMNQLHQANPQDDEAAIFDALALAMTAKRARNDYANEKQCDAILEPLFKKLPSHPGIAHYLIHCNDSPVMAERGLAAAREYAKIAPASAHATHMPSHIFIQVGDWNATIASNQASLEAAKNDKEATACERAGNMLHAMDFMIYGLIQSGRTAEARKINERQHQVPREVPGFEKCDQDLAFNDAWHAITARDWKAAAQLAKSQSRSNPYSQTGVLFATGMAAAHAGDHAKAKEAIDALAASREQAAKTSPLGTKNFAEVLRLWVAAADSESANKLGEATELYRQAADLQEQIPVVGSVFPSARQYLGEVLLRAGHAKEALAEFNRAEKLWPNRFDILYDTAQAAEKSGHQAVASAHYQKLLAVAASDERPEVATARQRLSEIAQARGSGGNQ